MPGRLASPTPATRSPATRPPSPMPPPPALTALTRMQAFRAAVFGLQALGDDSLGFWECSGSWNPISHPTRDISTRPVMPYFPLRSIKKRRIFSRSICWKFSMDLGIPPLE